MTRHRWWRWVVSQQQPSRRLFSSFPDDHGLQYLFDPSKSHVIGPRHPALVERTVDDHFRSCVEKYPDRLGLVVAEGSAKIDARLTFEEIDVKVDALARGLLKLGIKTGDRVGAWMPNNEAWFLCQFATARIGAVLVAINPSYRKRELVHALNLVGLSVLLMNPKVATSNYIEMIETLLPNLKASQPINCKEIPELRHIVLAESTGTTEEKEKFVLFEDLLDFGGPSPTPTAKVSPMDPINVQFTSGTTGSPKAASLSSHSLVNQGRYIGACEKLSEKDKINIPVPMYHCFGMVLGTMAAISYGAATVFPARVFDPEKTLQLVEAEKCTALYGVPTMFAGMLAVQRGTKFDVSSLRTGIMAGSPCPASVMRRCVTEMNLREICIAYGQTETSPVSFMSRVSDPEFLRCETVGRIMPNTECKVVDASGNTVPIGGQGELLTKGYLTMIGYWGAPELTKEAFSDDGFLKTGDLVSLDKDGYLRVEGRLKDVIIRGGENIAPREIEEVIHEVPGVHAVAVVGVPDENYGEEICAIVIPEDANESKMTADQIVSFVKSQISHQKVPRFVLFRGSLDDALTVSGKLKKFVLRDWAAKMLSEEKRN